MIRSVPLGWAEIESMMRKESVFRFMCEVLGDAAPEPLHIGCMTSTHDYNG